jgi:tRNA nucleotidyltransferase (CCA-adding enzyme)
VRCVGVPAERFGEDGLRPLRAVRFATVLEFELDPETAAAIPGALPVFDKVALERRREELLKLLLAPGVGRGLELLRSTGSSSGSFPSSTSRGPGAERAGEPRRAGARGAAGRAPRWRWTRGRGAGPAPAAVEGGGGGDGRSVRIRSA